MDDWGIGAAELQLLAQWAGSQDIAWPPAVQGEQAWQGEQAFPQQVAPNMWPAVQQTAWSGQQHTPQIVTPNMKGAGKAMGKPQWQGMGEDPIYIAINTAMGAVPPEDLITANDGAWDSETLKRRIAKYFKSAAKGLDFSGGAEKVVNDYADAALGNVSWALSGTKWLNKADFTLVLEIAISELFPDEFKMANPGHALEEIILKAHDRALEEALFAPVLLDTVKELVEGKKSSNKVHNAAEAARRELVAKMNEVQDDSADFHSAFENGVQEKIEEFVGGWIRGTLKALGDWPESIIDRKDCTTLFQRLVVKEDVCLPRSLVRYMVEPLPEDWDFVTNTINEIYDAAEANAEDYSSTKKSRKNYLKDYDGPNFSYKTEVCRNIANTGFCKMGDWCVFAHHESELFAHRSGALGPGLPYGRGHEVEGEGSPPLGMLPGMKGGKKKGFGTGKDYTKGYGKSYGPIIPGKGKYGKGSMAKGGYASPYGKGGYGKSSGKRRFGEEEVEGQEEYEQELALEDEGEVDEEGGLGPGVYAHDIEEE